MKIKNILFCMVALLWCNMTQAHDFELDIDGQKIYFVITDNNTPKAEVTYNGSIVNATPGHYEGDLAIPQNVKFNNKIYTISGITAKAFSGATKLRSVKLPGTIKRIGDFAFENCRSLKNIVFQSQAPIMGEGVFFKCDSITNITFGSDWKTIDLKMFCWSRTLNQVYIPANVEKISGLKSLKNLTSITVDANNSNFCSHSGVLYSKDGKVLYGCPRAYSGILKIHHGTQTIYNGSIADCDKVTTVVVASTVEKMSFREFGRMYGLKEIVFLNNTPINTALCEGHEIFVLQMPNADANVLVPQGSIDAYHTTLIDAGGEYSETDNNIPIKLHNDETLTANRIKEIENTYKYE